MRKFFGFLAVLLGILAGYLIFWPVQIDPVAWTPQESPGKTGPFASNDMLSDLTRLADGKGVGPEDTAIGPAGWLYAGYADGRIVRINPIEGSEAEASEIANTGGRPLGLQFDAAGNLIIADALKGLLSLSPDGEVSLLTDSVDGERMIFVDDLDIGSDGKIWFSDASTRFDLHDNLLDAVESRKTGRLLTYDPSTGTTKVELDELGFANGVALSADESFVLVNETFRYRVTRLWLQGPKAGQSDWFIENLPAHPDNISRAPDGGFWVALVAPRSADLDQLLPTPFWRKLLVRLPEALQGSLIEPYGWVVKADEEGQVVANLQDPTGKFGTITSVNERSGILYLGSLTEEAVGRIQVP
ncbi:MAG: SMP-30/gluconolactonase/LRE family protein [Rhodobiaceae bacterium]|nr:SMP-30/gluconolactonase/LRE family protein [Rhodobiaceae bacterium]